MFTGDFAESTAMQQEVKDVSAEAFEGLLHFIYTGNLPNDDVPIDEMITIADRYGVSDLVKLCETKLLLRIDSDNAEQIFRLTSSIQCNEEIKKTAFDILQS
jgi:hypothetical protein